MSHHVEDLIHDFAEKCRTKITEFENTRVRCGLIGPSGSGKSSLINAIAGEKIAAVGVVETTHEPQEHVHKGIVCTDLPGCGTQKWPKETYIDKLKLKLSPRIFWMELLQCRISQENKHNKILIIIQNHESNRIHQERRHRRPRLTDRI